MEKAKNLPLRKDFTVVRLNKNNKAYICEYDLANAFYKGLTSFKNTLVESYNGFYKTIAVISYEDKESYVSYGNSVEFCNLYEYVSTCVNRRLKNRLVYDVNRNVYNLDYETLRNIERSK